MTAQGNYKANSARVEALLRTPDAAPWHAAPAGLHERVMASLDRVAPLEAQPGQLSGGVWRITAIAASIAIGAGGIGLMIGAAAWRNIPSTSPLASGVDQTATVFVASTGDQPLETPTVVLARAFEDLRPSGSSRLVASVAAPMRSEAQGLVAETRHAARTVLSRLPFVSME